MKDTVFTAIILKRVEYGDSDLIIKLFTKEKGNISVIAKGGRKSKKRYEGGLSPYILYNATVSESKYGKLDYLKNITIMEYNPQITINLNNIAVSACATEILNEFTKYPEQEELLFDLTTDFYKNIGRTDSFSLLAKYIYNITTLTGFSPNIFTCSNCNTVLNNEVEIWNFDSSYSGILCPSCTIESNSAWYLSFTEFLTEDLKLEQRKILFLLNIMINYVESILNKHLRSKKLLLMNQQTY